ncbi:hypothetical protein [Clostridium sp. AF22-10]|jgi:hypothetical protein|uniref:hypothetical protein n=1 Tax=Clostridium sp. AF22-10 TaxID=2293004 RepID=UPI0015F88851
MQFTASRAVFEGVSGYMVQQVRPDGSIASSQFMDDSSFSAFFTALGIQPLILDN